jgi:hypothetical protein
LHREALDERGRFADSGHLTAAQAPAQRVAQRFDRGVNLGAQSALAAAFRLPVQFEAADPSPAGASVAEAMAAAGTLELTAVEWAATMDGFRGDGAEAEGLEEQFDWIGAAALPA